MINDNGKTPEHFDWHASSGPNPQSPIPNPLLTSTLRQEIAALLPKYPTKQAAVLPSLHAINDRLGYVPIQAVVELAVILELSPAQVQDTLSFYGFFRQDKPMAKYRLTICESITCAACGSGELLKHACERLNIQPGETTADGRVTLETVECLGACDTAPSIMVNDMLHGNMTPERLEELITTWK
jgi:NADH-quinone oxidoreductase subunit E